MIFITITKKAIEKLTPAQAYVLGFLDVATGKGEGETEVTTQEIADEVHLAKNTVTVILQKMKAAGWITTRKKYGRRYISLAAALYEDGLLLRKKSIAKQNK